jgi:hypothetical protein
LSKYTTCVSKAKTPNEILDALDDFASRLLPIDVLGAGRMPLLTSDWPSIQLGRDVFLHSSAPVEWWNEYAAMAARGYDPGIMMAKTSLVAYTWTETMQTLGPIGTERWPYELALKYGIRDALTCCVGQRWLVAYWSRQVLSGADATAADPSGCRRRICGPAARTDDRRRSKAGREPAPVTPRELAVLRLVSLGKGTHEIAKLLGIGERLCAAT